MYALCVSGAVNTQCFVWKFFYALYIHLHSFIHFFHSFIHAHSLGMNMNKYSNSVQEFLISGMSRAIHLQEFSRVDVDHWHIITVIC